MPENYALNSSKYFLDSIGALLHLNPSIKKLHGAGVRFTMPLCDGS